MHNMLEAVLASLCFVMGKFETFFLSLLLLSLPVMSMLPPGAFLF